MCTLRSCYWNWLPCVTVSSSQVGNWVKNHSVRAIDGFCGRCTVNVFHRVGQNINSWWNCKNSHFSFYALWILSCLLEHRTNREVTLLRYIWHLHNNWTATTNFLLAMRHTLFLSCSQSFFHLLLSLQSIICTYCTFLLFSSFTVCSVCNPPSESDYSPLRIGS